MNENLIKKEIHENQAITGDSNKNKYFLLYLRSSFSHAKSIDIIVSFLMESGVKLLLDDIKEAVKRGTKIRILTGNYLGITQPNALYLLKNELGEQIELKFYNDSTRSFHPKAYIFHNDNNDEIYIGSSNISKSALTSGIEWNYRFTRKKDEVNYNEFYETFLDLYTNHSILIDDEVLEEYARNWKKPPVLKQITELKQTDNKIVELFQPRGAQIEAMYCLKKVVEEGAKKALIVCATGVGKTYISAFFSKNYKRILFVGHRTEILKQACESYKNIRKDDTYGYFAGDIKETDKDMIFASVYTLGKEEYLNENYFPKDYFDFICYDEVHHGTTKMYQSIMNYFEPKFMLGLTATPERMDGRDIFKLFDYIVPYEINLKTAINRRILTPFRYYGIHDDTVNYDEVEINTNGTYKTEILEQKLMINKRMELVYKNYLKHKTSRALGFCTSRLHAEKMAEYFNAKGTKAIAVYSGELKDINKSYRVDRNKAIEQLKSGKIKVVFSIDMFNEGVDIPNVDMVMFLRPTESKTIYLQQLGRGLRSAPNKKYLTVLDFIGNYKKAGLAPFLLSGQSYKRESLKRESLKDIEYPEDCFVDFDFRIIDIFEKLARENINKEIIIKEEYIRVKKQLGYIPTRLELFTYMQENVYTICKKNSSKNPFRNYIEYISENDEISNELLELKETIGMEFINLIETTAMTKSYKMPILLAFYNNGDMKLSITKEDVSKSYRDFYNKGVNGRDFEKQKNTRNFRQWSDKDYLREAKKNPIKYLKQSGKGFFVERKDYELGLCDELKEVIKNTEFIKQFKDVIDYRTYDYYKQRYDEGKK